MEQNYCIDTKAPPNEKRQECYRIYGALMKSHLLIDEIYDMCIDNDSELARNIINSIKNYESSFCVK